MPASHRSAATAAPNPINDRTPEEADAADPLVAAPTPADAARRDSRERRVAERAYRRAEQRGFVPGHELDDWLAAEAEEEGDPER